VEGQAITYTPDLAAPLVVALVQQIVLDGTIYLCGPGDSSMAEGKAGVRRYPSADGKVLIPRGYGPHGVPQAEIGRAHV
jgi:hypothetical protein